MYPDCSNSCREINNFFEGNGHKSPNNFKNGNNRCLNTLRPWCFLLFESCSAGMEGRQQMLVQLALGDICARGPRQHHLLPDLLAPTTAKKLCAKCLHRDKHSTQNTAAFLMGKKIKRRESTWGQHFCALKALLCCPGLIFFPSATP